jgi:hypothetical protein
MPLLLFLVGKTSQKIDLVFQVIFFPQMINFETGATGQVSGGLVPWVHGDD